VVPLHFPTTVTRAVARRRLGIEPLAGEASPYYLYHPLAPERAAALVPHARIVVLLRDPVERAFSHYKERRDNSTEPLSFADALDAEGDRVTGEEERIVAEPQYVSVPHRHQTYVAQGMYATPVRRWIEAFGRERVLVRPSELLYRRTQATFDEICDHVGLPPYRLIEPRAHEARPSIALDATTRRRLRAMLADSVAELESNLGTSMGWPQD